MTDFLLPIPVTARSAGLLETGIGSAWTPNRYDNYVEERVERSVSAANVYFHCRSYQSRDDENDMRGSGRG